MKWECTEVNLWKVALSSYKSGIEALSKPNLISLDEFYTNELPRLIKQRNPKPYITTDELSKLMQWKLTRGKWRPRLLDFVSSLDDDVVKTASQKAFGFLPDVSKAVKELTVLKGVGPATASAILAAYAPDVVPFMSDEELTTEEEDPFTPSDVERALWSCAVAAKSKSKTSPTDPDEFSSDKNTTKRKRKR